MNGKYVTLHDGGFNRLSALDRIFDNFLNPWDFGLTGELARTLSPKIDVEETEDEIRVQAELPGLDEKDIEVNVSSQGYLTIKGEKKEEKHEKSKGKYLSECSYGMVQRTIALPVDVDSEKTTAKLKSQCTVVILTFTCAG